MALGSIPSSARKQNKQNIWIRLTESYIEQAHRKNVAIEEMRGVITHQAFSNTK
jgi:hypothetical protein